MVDINKKFNKLLEKFLSKFIKAIKIDYGIGSANAIINAKKQGKKTSMNPLNLTKKDQEAFTNQIETFLKDVNSENAKKINFIINKGITERWSTKMVSEELKDLFNKDIPGHFTYKNRFDTIAQDLSFDVMSTSSHNTSKRLGAKKKWIFNVMDSKTADDSKENARKYGSEDKAIPIDEPFSYIWKGKERVFMYGRDRPRDRSQTVYVFD